MSSIGLIWALIHTLYTLYTLLYELSTTYTRGIHVEEAKKQADDPPTDRPDRPDKNGPKIEEGGWGGLNRPGVH